MKNLKEQFTGKWESIALEKRPNTYGGENYLRRYFHNSENEANGTLVFYTDKTARHLNMILTVIGSYQFGRLSKDVSGAIEADFNFTRFILTPKSEAMVRTLNDSRPAKSKLKTWLLNESQIIDSGIEEGIFGMVIGKYKEYDLVKIEGNKLYYGERPADGTAPDSPEKRAKGLQVPLKKVSEFSMDF